MTDPKLRSKLYPLFTMLIGCLAFFIASSIILVTFYITNGNGYFYIFYIVELYIFVPALSGLLLSLLLGMKKERLKMTVAVVVANLIIVFFVRMVVNLIFMSINYETTSLQNIISILLASVVFTIAFGLIVDGFNQKVMLWFGLAGTLLAVPAILLAVANEPVFQSTLISELIPQILDWMIRGAGVGLGIGFCAFVPEKLPPDKTSEISAEAVTTAQHPYHPLLAALFGLAAYLIGGLIAMFGLSFLDYPSDFIGLFVPILGAAVGWLLLCLMLRWFSKLIPIVILGVVGTTIELFIGYFLSFILGFMLMGSRDVTQMIAIVIWFIVLNAVYGNLMLAIALYFGKINGRFRLWLYTSICGITAIPFGILYCLLYRIQFLEMRLFPLIIIVSLGLGTSLCIGLSSRLPENFEWFKK